MTMLVTLLVLAALFNAMMDLIAHGKTKYNPDEIWKYKYKKGKLISESNERNIYSLIEYKKKWYHFGFVPEYEERFPFSSTIFVGLVDPWHLFQMLFHSCWQLAIAIQFDHWILWFVFIKFIFSLQFEIIYRIIKNAKKEM